MEIFKIEIREILSKIVEIKAHDSAEAVLEATKLYEAGEIGCDYNENFVDYDITDFAQYMI